MPPTHHRQLVAGGRYDGLLTRLGSVHRDLRGRFRRLQQLARRRAAMITPFVIAVPAKGRLAAKRAFFARTGLRAASNRVGVRDTAARLPNFPGSRWRISRRPDRRPAAQGVVAADDRRGIWYAERSRCGQHVILTRALLRPRQCGGGRATGLDGRARWPISTTLRPRFASHKRKMRLATKYENPRATFFSAHDITDYRIVESADEHRGRAGGRHRTNLIQYDITTTGATLAANGLRVIEDGVISCTRGQPRRGARGQLGAEEREIARLVIDRIASAARRAHFAKCARGLQAATRHCARSEGAFAVSIRGPTAPASRCTLRRTRHALAMLREKGTKSSGRGYRLRLFSRQSVYAKLEAGLPKHDPKRLQTFRISQTEQTLGPKSQFKSERISLQQAFAIRSS